MWQIIDWIIWGMLALLSLSFAYGCRKRAKIGQGFQLATGVQTLFFWTISILFLIFDWNKLHILWITPVAFFAAGFLTLAAIPLLSPLILFATKIFLRIIFVGIKNFKLNN